MVDNSETSLELQFFQFQEGNERAFKYFFDLYYAQIAGFCRQFVYDEDKANSIAQEAFINLWLNRSNVFKPSGIKSFLYTSARSKCLNHIKHEKVVSRYQNESLGLVESQLNMEVLHSMDFDSLTLVELDDLIRKSIAELPEKTRKVFLLKRQECKRNAEIAIDLEISVKSVEAHMTKALKFLREKLADYLPAFLIGLYFS